MNDSINHAMLICGLLERDIARICASGNSAQQGLAADCAEHRLQLANKLRHIQDIGSLEDSYAKGLTLGDALKKADAEQSRDRYEASAKAGDFNPYAYDGFGDINEPDDDTYMRHAEVSDAKALADYQRRVRNLGWVMAAIALGAIIAIVEIVATICG